ncbi:MAG: hypothetical protein K8U03_01015 [Planctomycetia bacterium]|nr:hypothetical protein [Planctomycetia bacterium]
MLSRALSISLVLLSATSLTSAAEPPPAEVFERRIVPIFKSPNPSSCTQCHLAGVDLKNYILPSSEKTFLSLRDQGLIDLKSPEQSKILKLIAMRDPEQTSAAALIHEKVRQVEHEAFAAWIAACAADKRLTSAPKLATAELAEPQRPVEVIRHARKDQVLESFESSVWAMRFRCMSCHIEGTKDNDKLRAEHGDQVAWIKKAGSQATLDYLVEAKLIDLEQPTESLLLKKPLMTVKHGGGKKFLMGDQGYKAFRGWIEDYAKLKADEYATAAALPKESDVERVGSDIWIKLMNTPPAWGDALVQVDIHAWNDGTQMWEAKPIASTDRANFGKGRLWQHNLTLYKNRDDKAAPQAGLPPGRYLLKAFVDRTGKLSADWTAPLDATDFAGQTEFEAKWKPGYGGMTAIDGGKLAK